MIAQFFATRKKPPFVIAHRGARAHSPENTLMAAKLGLSAQADMWEMDVRYTKDGQLIVFHDDTLERTTNVAATMQSQSAPFRVCDFTLAELQTLDAGSWFIATDPFGQIAAGEVATSCTAATIPTLEEALLLVKKHDWRVNVEIKDHAHLVGHDSIAQDVINMIQRLDMVDHVLLSSFQHNYLGEAKKLLPELPRAVLTEGMRPASPVELCRTYGAIAWHPDRELVSAEDIAKCLDAGIYVNVWTVNDMQEAKHLADLGVTGIITDFPKACRELFKNEQ